MSSLPNIPESTPMFQMPHAHVLITGGSFTNVTHIDTSVDYTETIEKYFKEYIAPDATHDTNGLANPPRCHPGTRTTILQSLFVWAQNRVNPSFISWVFGSAGVGKSAIARSLADLLAMDGLLGASFFFFRTADKRNTEKFLFPTIAYQLAYSNPDLQPHIATAVKGNPLILRQSLGSQFLKLVVEPVCLAPNQKSPRIIIIDGLDECQDRDAQRLILTTISESAPRLAGRLKFLILSRPEHHIERAFSEPTLHSLTLPIDLNHDLTAFDDILLFLTAKFDDIKRTHPLKSRIDPSWPGEEAIQMLVWKSSGNFIYPQTVMKYIETDYEKPESRLKIILGRSPSSDSPFAELDDLYFHILSCVRTNHGSLLLLLRALLACRSNTDVSAFSFTTAFVENILLLDPGDARLLLVDLQSLVHFERDLECDWHTFPQFLHKSFSDFLLDRSRSKEHWVDLEKGYLDISIGTLKYLQSGDLTTTSVVRCGCDLNDLGEMSVLSLQSYYYAFFWSHARCLPSGTNELHAAVLAHGSGRLFRVLLSDDTDDEQWLDVSIALSYFLRLLQSSQSKDLNDVFQRHLINFDTLVSAFLDKYYNGNALLEVCLTVLSAFSSFSPVRIDNQSSLCIALVCLFHPTQSICYREECLKFLCKAIAEDSTEDGRRGLIARAILEATGNQSTPGMRPLKFLAKALVPFLINHNMRQASPNTEPILKVYPPIAPLDSVLWNYPMHFLASFLADRNRSGLYHVDDQKLYHAILHLISYISPTRSSLFDNILAQEPFTGCLVCTLLRLLVLLLYEQIGRFDLVPRFTVRMPRADGIQIAKQVEAGLHLAFFGVSQRVYASKESKILKGLVESFSTISRLDEAVENDPLTPCLLIPTTTDYDHWERWDIPDRWVIEPLGKIGNRYVETEFTGHRF
ncbi:hypothetical protein GALMADRAFT_146247 [Galerina marginata CBS 339.88]|uniref:Nephrocystin 3-like N-terminal domain-containing protein n=1 Tax=Galerina marginata (strain CBS 339.88) TaxID=685588 RepID=A0A067SCD3_GALM3|nr:hypothetical protein GALMADRAFT_146247 [Galerina marginata CBS 339.88]